MELTSEEKEAIWEVVDSEGFAVLVARVFPQLLEQQQSKLLTTSTADAIMVNQELIKYQAQKELIGKLSTLKAFLKKGDKRTP